MNLQEMIDYRGFFSMSPFSDRRLIVHPAHPTNYYGPTSGRGLCKPIAMVFHEPQEPADNYESTPVYFSSPNRDASTRFYTDNDGDLYQLVPIQYGAIANGLDRRPMPRFNDGGPEFGAFSLNLQTDNNEVEGYTHNIAQTFTQAQWDACVDWCVLGLIMYELPRNVGRFLSHKQLSVDRSDGEWIVTKSGIPQEAVKRVLALEKDVKNLQILAVEQAVKMNGFDNRIKGLEMNVWSQAVRINDLEKHTAHPPK